MSRSLFCDVCRRPCRRAAADNGTCPRCGFALHPADGPSEYDPTKILVTIRCMACEDVRTVQYGHPCWPGDPWPNDPCPSCGAMRAVVAGVRPCPHAVP